MTPRFDFMVEANYISSKVRMSIYVEYLEFAKHRTTVHPLINLWYCFQILQTKDIYQLSVSGMFILKIFFRRFEQA